ncbi:MAG TPA: hypothetical protein VG370_33075 [Chloroflexota bacterium]|nr:hypothetical protein [Chloroflexota bacterium]
MEATKMTEVRWERFPLVAGDPRARSWLAIQADLGLAARTVEAYGRALEDYLRFSARHGVASVAAGRAHVAAYVRDLTSRPGPRGDAVRVLDSGAGLANATPPNVNYLWTSRQLDVTLLPHRKAHLPGG